jgi:hypothetical protein
MKRALGTILIGVAAVTALAQQTSFTIVRPADGSRVRENIKLLFPKDSIPETGYVGIYIGGKFVEAVVPAPSANYRYYDIDTKARGIQDGPLTIEAVLYVDFGDRTRVIDRSSIQVMVGNSDNITVPTNGFDLGYKFRPGTKWIYNLRQRVAVSNLSEAMSRSTSRQSLLAGADVENIRLLYAVDDAYAGGDGLVRIQALPEKGKHTLTLTTENSDVARTFQDYEVHPVYMRISRSGHEVFGSVPRYFPLEGTAGEGFRTDLFVPYPLPTLPKNRVRPGEPFTNAVVQLGDLDLNRIADTKSIVTPIERVRGDVVGIEWQNGHPCVRLRHSLAVNDPRAASAGQGRVRNAQSIEEDIWFALDLGTVIKMVRTYTIDARIAAPTGGGAAGAGGGRAAGGNTPTASGAGAGSAGGGQGAVANWFLPGLGGKFFKQFGGDAPIAGGAGRGGQGGAPTSSGAGAGGAAGGRTGGGGGATRIVRMMIEQVFELEK